MHRCGSAFLLTLAITFVVALTGCLGKATPNSGNGGVTTVTLSPTGYLSIDIGGIQNFTATGKDASGKAVLGVNIQFVVGVPPGATGPAPLSLTSSGSACAGTWDSSGAMCSPGNPGIAVVTAVINGVSSPPTTAYVHQHINRIEIVNAQTQPPQYDCFSQGQTWLFQAIAYSNNVDITNTVGYLNWSSSNAGVVNTTTYVPPSQPNVLNQIQTTAAVPGITQLFATAAGTTSSPYSYTTCLIKAIYLQIGAEGALGNSITVNNGGTVSVTATAVDTLYGISNATPLLTPPLTWSTTNPEVAGFSSITNTTGTNSATARNNLGGATVFASCTPPTCNIGVLPSLPIYSSDCLATGVPPCHLPNGTNAYGTISIDVTSTTAVPTYTAWAATTDCGNGLGCTSALFSVTPGTVPIGTTILSLPRTPNSMMFNHLAAPHLYFGSDQGLMYVDFSASALNVSLVSNTSTPCNVALCGKVLTTSNDGKLVVVSDTVSTPSQVYIYNGSSTTAVPVDLILSAPGETATAAAFSPDQLKLFILTNLGNMYVYSTVDPLTSVPIATSAADVKFSADGSFAYVAGTPGPTSVSGFANCDTPATSVLSGVTTAAAPLAIYPLPTLQLDSAGNWTEGVVVLDPPNIDEFGVNVTQSPLPNGQFVCIPPSVVLDPDFPKTSHNLGQGNFTPLYTQLVADGTEVIVVASRIPAVLLFSVSNGTTTSIPLSGSPKTGCPRCTGPSIPLSASASTDGSQVYVAACDQYAKDGTTCAAGSVHIVCTSACTTGQGDYQQVPYVNVNDNNNPNMCNNQGSNAPLCLPNLIAIKPQ
jgi:hypothetical protein